MKKHIPGLDGLRGISILIVLLHHLNLRNLGNHVPSQFFLGFDGQLGVNIFFILSGFLITTLLLKEEAANRTVSLKAFFIRRSFRIFPVYYIFLAVYLLLQLNGILHISNASWITAVTYTKYLNYKADWETGHLWSLSIEEQFYMVWPFVFVLAKRFRKHFAFGVILAVPVLRLLAQRYHISWVMPLSIFQRADALMWGCVFAMYYDQIVARMRLILSKYPVLTVSPFAMLLFMEVAYNVNVAYNLHLSVLMVPLAGTTGTIADICVGLIILISINYQGNLWFRLLDNKVIKHIGKLSYSLYLWQQLFFSEEIGPAGKWPLNILLIIVVAHLSYYLIEMPFLKLKSKIEGCSGVRASEGHIQESPVLAA